MGSERVRIDAFRQEVSGPSANEQPVLQHGPPFLTSADYAPRIRAYVFLGLSVAALLAFSGCGGDGDDGTPVAKPPTTTTNATTTTTPDGIDPLEGAATTPVQSEVVQGEISLLERVAIGRHEGFDRVVFQFRNRVPGFRVEYVQPPLKEDGSGNVVKIEGNAFVLVRMEQASGFDLTVDEGELVYKGPRRLAGSAAGTAVLREVVRTGDFEAVLSWAVGLEDKVDFRVRTAASPARLIVDFRNH
jgi:hypothetical protein